VTDKEKHSNLLTCGIDYSCKNFYGASSCDIQKEYKTYVSWRLHLQWTPVNTSPGQKGLTEKNTLAY